MGPNQGNQLSHEKWLYFATWLSYNPWQGKHEPKFGMPNAKSLFGNAKCAKMPNMELFWHFMMLAVLGVFPLI